MDRSVYERLGINVDYETAEQRFRNKLYPDIFNCLLIQRALFCKEYGLRDGYNSDVYFSNELDFYEYIARVECLLHIMIVEPPFTETTFLNSIKKALNESPVDLGIEIIQMGNKPVFIKKGSPLLVKAVVTDLLGIFEGNKSLKNIETAYTNGLKQLLQVCNQSEAYHNVIRDMQLSLDELAKFILGNKDLGFKHLLQNTNWPKTCISDYYKRMYHSLNEMMDKEIKHNVTTGLTYQEVETIVYLTGILIRFIISAQK